MTNILAFTVISLVTNTNVWITKPAPAPTRPVSFHIGGLP